MTNFTGCPNRAGRKSCICQLAKKSLIFVQLKGSFLSEMKLYVMRLHKNDVMKFKTVAIFVHGCPFNKEKPMMSFRQFPSIADYSQSFTPAQKCTFRLAKFRLKLTKTLLKFN